MPKIIRSAKRCRAAGAELFDRVQRRYRLDGLAGVCRACSQAVLGTGPAHHPILSALQEIGRRSDFTIVQLGAFVGDSGNDPLFRTLSELLPKQHGTLVVVEPVAEYFLKLQAAYRGVPGVVFVNAAIADFCGRAPFYRLGVDPEDFGFPAWLSQLGSLREDRMNSLWDSYEGSRRLKRFFLEHRIVEMVDCITFMELLERCSIRSVDLLQMDVEGVEYEILKSIPFQRIPVRFVNFEHVLLQNRRARAEDLMQREGYLLERYYMDTFCYKPSDAALAACWANRRSRASPGDAA